MKRASNHRTAWWSASRGLPAEAYASWLASRAAAPESTGRPGHRPHILAWAVSADGFCVATRGELSIGQDSGWSHLGWHQIERGGWNVETSQLSWQLYGGRRGAVELAAPGRLPELFRERVAASIVVEKFVPLAGERGVVITARRNLDDSGSIEWHPTLTRGLSWQTGGVREAVEKVMAELRTEYDLG